MSHLHSTMLLLYLISNACCPVFSVFTFHYASTLSVPEDLARQYRLYLHSTMLLLYLNTICVFASTSPIFTFHYASTLSAIALVAPAIQNLIYIPLCFYFILQALDAMREMSNLHSTMLLLYRGRRFERISSDQFTFHYASTLSPYSESRIRYGMEFTFHYASTLSI